MQSSTTATLELTLDRTPAHDAKPQVVPDLDTDRYGPLTPLDDGRGPNRFEARDLSVGQHVEISKLVVQGHARAATVTSNDGAPGSGPRVPHPLLERAIRRCKTLAHRNLAGTFDLVADRHGDAWLVSELTRGTTLEELLGRGAPFAPADACEIAAQTLDALAVVHAAGLRHLELRPDSVVIGTPTSRQLLVKVLGVARSAAQQVARHMGHGRVRDDDVLKHVAYLAPELALGEGGDHRADIYAVAAMLHAMLAGRSPLRGDTARDQLRALLAEGPEPLGRTRPDLPTGLVHLIARGLARDVELRPSSAAQLATQLRSWIDRTRDPARRAPSSAGPSTRRSLAPPWRHDDEDAPRISEVVSLERERRRARDGDRDTRSSAPPAKPPSSPLPDDLLLEPVIPRAPPAPYFTNPPGSPGDGSRSAIDAHRDLALEAEATRQHRARSAGAERSGGDADRRSAWRIAQTRPARRLERRERRAPSPVPLPLRARLALAMLTGAVVGTLLGLALRLTL